MTSQSPRIYLYKITFEEVPYYYHGVHKERKYNEYYMGSPVTHKWVWDFYTPKKQILQFFDFTDEGWLEAQEVETRLIKPFFNTDKWCLNEGCGGVISLEIKRKNGKKIGRQHKENKTGIFALTLEQRRENGKIYGKISGRIAYENKIGVHALTGEERAKYAKISGKNTYELGLGIHSLTFEERSTNSKKSVQVTNSQRWECCVTGYVSTAAGVVSHQKGRKIDTSKSNRRRIQ
jgi:hypothetical protein